MFYRKEGGNALAERLDVLDFLLVDLRRSRREQWALNGTSRAGLSRSQRRVTMPRSKQSVREWAKKKRKEHAKEYGGLPLHLEVTFKRHPDRRIKSPTEWAFQRDKEASPCYGSGFPLGL